MTKWQLVVRAWVVVAAGSAVFYAVTGMPLWAPLTHDDGLRFALLFAGHLAPFLFIAWEFS